MQEEQPPPNYGTAWKSRGNPPSQHPDYELMCVIAASVRVCWSDTI
jgi:hypothetical protein